MKKIIRTWLCDVAGCNSVGTSDLDTMTEARAGLEVVGWRFGATRDVCPFCREKGHRP